MAELGEFYGVSLEYDNSEALFRGISLEYQENLIIKFFDSFGNPINDLDELEINDGTTVTVLNNVEGGSYSLYVETSTIFVVKATNDGKEGFASFIHDGDPQYLVIEIHLLTPPCREDQSSNNFNFFQFHRINNVAVDSIPSSFNSCNVGYKDFLPNGYLLNNKCYMPVIVPNEEVSIQINLDEPYTDDSGGFILSIVKNQEIVLDSVVGISKVTSGAGENFYFNWTLDSGILADGKGYHFMIYDVSSGNVVYFSNPFEISSTGYLDRTVYLEYRNSSDTYNFVYEILPTFYNKVRVHLNMINYAPEYSINSKTEQTTGQQISLKSIGKKTVTLESYFFDEYAHDAMMALSLHDDITANGKTLKIKTGYEIELEKQSNVNKGTIEFYDEKYSTVNYNI